MKYEEMYQEAKGNKQLRQLTAEYFEFSEEGKGFIGCLMGVNEVTSKLGGQGYNQYLFDTDMGLIKCAFGRATDGEAGALMKLGSIYSVKFLGSEKIAGGRKVNRFEVFGIMTEEEAMVGGEEDHVPEEKPEEKGEKKPAKEIKK